MKLNLLEKKFRICEEKFKSRMKRVKHHCHLPKQYREAAHLAYTYFVETRQSSLLPSDSEKISGEDSYLMKKLINRNRLNG